MKREQSGNPCRTQNTEHRQCVGSSVQTQGLPLPLVSEQNMNTWGPGLALLERPLLLKSKVPDISWYKLHLDWNTQSMEYSVHWNTQGIPREEFSISPAQRCHFLSVEEK